MLTAYEIHDHGKIVDTAGIDVILVDSASNVMAGNNYRLL
jgi:ketopantoate hydroxymethyltransferase